MSSVLLLVGQCGNQIGHELVKKLDASERHPLGHRDGMLRCVCVDSEAKVISRNMRDGDPRLTSRIRDANLIVGQRGRGNNWALGYHGLANETAESSLLHRSMETLRKEVEKCDSYTGSIIVHSLTGGTGSGLGSHLVESIRDTYPLAHILSVAVSPHVSGDSPLQSYNSLLSLAALQRSADGVVLFSNDDVLHRLSAHSAVAGKKHGTVSLSQMNAYIVNCLAGVLQPLDSKLKQESKTRASGRTSTVKNKLSKSDDSLVFRNLAGTRGRIFGKKGHHLVHRIPHGSQQWTKDVDQSSTLLGMDITVDSSRWDESDLSSSCSSSRSSSSFMAQQPSTSASALQRYQGTVQSMSSEARQTTGHRHDKFTSTVSCGNEAWEMLRSVCPEPSKKFLTMDHCAKTKVSWDAVAQSLIHSAQRYDKHGGRLSMIASLLVARGDANGSFVDSAGKIEERIKTAFGCVRWNPLPVDIWIGKQSAVGLPSSQSLTFCQNSTKVVDKLECFIGKARLMYDAGAYLHWYWKHGCSQGDFMDAFDTLQTVVEDYRCAATY